MPWGIIGNFNHVNILDMMRVRTRHVCFNNTAPGAVISQLIFFYTEHMDNHRIQWHITACASNPAAYRELMTQAIARELMPPGAALEPINPEMDLSEDILNPRGIHLLQCVQAIEPSFDEIRGHINQIFNTGLPHADAARVITMLHPHYPIHPPYKSHS